MDRVNVALVGCGSVSNAYLRDLTTSSHARVVAVCDVMRDRAENRARQYGIPKVYTDLEAMLATETFDLLVNTTSMPHHGPCNEKALLTGRHVFCEKPIATDLAHAARLLSLADERGVQLWGAPNATLSPAFAAMAEVIAGGEIGAVHAASGRYGHGGTTWGPWFYKAGGGSLFDLGVYNVTTLTGLLGPAVSVMALAGIAVPERVIEGERIRVEADDNTVLVLDHGNARYSCIQTGFVFGAQRDDWTIEVIGTEGAMVLLGYDWAPQGVELRRKGAKEWSRRATDQHGYLWENGASAACRHLITGEPFPMTKEHAYHVLEVMLAALESGKSGKRVPVSSRFPDVVLRRAS